MNPDWSKMSRIGRVMADRPMTIEEIQKRARVSKRTAYRWIQAFEDKGCLLARVRVPGGLAYRIMEAPKGLFERVGHEAEATEEE